MTTTPPEVFAPTEAPTPPIASSPKPDRARSVQPVLEKLFGLYPNLFGAQFLPLKLGVFQELLAKHPDQFERDTLKIALGLHTRSGRYLQSVAMGNPRHDLEGAVVEEVSPEHIYLALLELFRRRQARAKEDLRPKFRAQLLAAVEASGLSRQDYQARVQTKDEHATALLDEVLAEFDLKQAKQEALLRAFESSGKTPAEFADMYGMNERDVVRALALKSQQVPVATP